MPWPTLGLFYWSGIIYYWHRSALHSLPNLEIRMCPIWHRFFLYYSPAIERSGVGPIDCMSDFRTIFVHCVIFIFHSFPSVVFHYPIPFLAFLLCYFSDSLQIYYPTYNQIRTFRSNRLWRYCWDKINLISTDPPLPPLYIRCLKRVFFTIYFQLFFGCCRSMT